MSKNRTKSAQRMIKRFIETENLVAVVRVLVIFAAESPAEPLLEAKTIKFLDEAARRARAGDKNWLRQQGAKIYIGANAA